MKDYYAILELNRGASQKDLRRAYRRLSKEYHPDTNPGNSIAEEKFKDIYEAYRLLSDPKKRQEYDRKRGTTGYSHTKTDDDKNTNGYKKAGKSVNYTYSDLSHAFLNQLGKGLFSLFKSLDRFLFAIESKVRTGARSFKDIILFAVRECSVRREDKASFDDDFFSRSGTDIKCEAEIGFVQAALGCKIKIRTIDNSRVGMEIPPGTHSGTVFRLKGLGLKNYRGRGDQLVAIKVMIPSNMTQRQKVLLKEFTQEEREKSKRTEGI